MPAEILRNITHQVQTAPERTIRAVSAFRDRAITTYRKHERAIKNAIGGAALLTLASLFYAPQIDLPMFVHPVEAAVPNGDPNDPKSDRFRGWEAQMITDNDHRHAKIFSEGKFPPADRFHLFGDYYAQKIPNDILFRNGWISPTGGGKGLLTRVDIVNSGGQIVGEGSMYSMYDGQPDSFSGSLTLNH